VELSMEYRFLNAFKWADFDPSMMRRRLKKKVMTAIILIRAGKNSG
jgi:hypothetical protein